MTTRRQPWPWEAPLEPVDLEGHDPMADSRALLERVQPDTGPSEGARISLTAPSVGSWRRGRDGIVSDCMEVYGLGREAAVTKATEIVKAHVARNGE